MQILKLTVLAFICAIALGCGDDGPGDVTVGDGLDGGGSLDSSVQPNDIPDSGPPILGGGCDAATGKCVNKPNSRDASFEGEDAGGGGDGGSEFDAG